MSAENDLTVKQLLKSVIDAYPKSGHAQLAAGTAASLLRGLWNLKVEDLTPEVIADFSATREPTWLERTFPDAPDAFEGALSFLEYCAIMRGLRLPWLAELAFTRSNWTQEIRTEEVLLINDYNWRIHRVWQKREYFRGSHTVLDSGFICEVPGQTELTDEALQRARGQLSVIPRFPRAGWSVIEDFFKYLCRDDKELRDLVDDLIHKLDRYRDLRSFKDLAREEWASKSLRYERRTFTDSSDWIDPTEPGVSKNLTPKQLAILASPGSLVNCGIDAEPRSIEPQPLPANRARVDAYIDEVLRKTGKRITRKDIWAGEGYTDDTEFQRWQRGDPKTSDAAARKFANVLARKPHLN